MSDNNHDIAFDQSWLKYAIPMKNDKLDSCYRYAPKNLTANEPGKCSADMFDTSKKIACTEYIHGSNEVNLQTEVSKTTSHSSSKMSSQILHCVIQSYFRNEFNRRAKRTCACAVKCVGFHSVCKCASHTKVF